jgi:hypothetical protein
MDVTRLEFVGARLNNLVNGAPFKGLADFKRRNI